MSITKDKVSAALLNVDIVCRGDGSGYEEFCIMDSDFRGVVRFKDFCKFVKNHKKGKAYDDSDSSLSTSDFFDAILKNMWISVDPERNC